MPALEKIGNEPMVVLDCSDFSIPLEAEQGSKAKKLFELCGVLGQLFPSAPSPVPLLMWDVDLTLLTSAADQSVLQGMPKGMMIMDRDGLRSMGLVL